MLLSVSISAAHAQLPNHIQSPKKQLDSGVTLDSIMCKKDLILVQRNNGHIACVSHEIIEKLNWKIIIRNEKSDLMKQVKPQSVSTLPKQSLEINKEIQFHLEPSNAFELIPVGPFDKTINITEKNMDMLAHKISAIVDDEIFEYSDFNTSKRYKTHGGSIYLWNDGAKMLEYSGVVQKQYSYDHVEQIALELINELNITFDGTEHVYNTTKADGNHLFFYQQTKDGVKISNNIISVRTYDSRLYVTVSNWNNNLSDIEIISDHDLLRQISMSYALEFEDLANPPCSIENQDNIKHENDLINLKILKGTPIYTVYAGTCKIPAALWSEDFFTHIDAITGEPLFIERGPSL